MEHSHLLLVLKPQKLGWDVLFYLHHSRFSCPIIIYEMQAAKAVLGMDTIQHNKLTNGSNITVTTGAE